MVEIIIPQIIVTAIGIVWVIEKLVDIWYKWEYKLRRKK